MLSSIPLPTSPHRVKAKIHYASFPQQVRNKLARASQLYLLCYVVSQIPLQQVVANFSRSQQVGIFSVYGKVRGNW